MGEERKVPTGEQILRLLVDLLADQHKVKVTYTVERRSNGERVSD